MIKIFISQPMNGLQDADILEERDRLVKRVKYMFFEPDDEVVCIDSFHHEDPPEHTRNKRIWHLGESIKQMGEADYICFAPGWKNYKGCKAEHKVASLYGMKILVD